jgi:hypothetical protein
MQCRLKNQLQVFSLEGIEPSSLQVEIAIFNTIVFRLLNHVEAVRPEPLWSLDMKIPVIPPR